MIRHLSGIAYLIELTPAAASDIANHFEEIIQRVLHMDGELE